MKQREALVQQLQQQVVELQQNNARLTAELTQLRQENERLRQQAFAHAQEQSAQDRSAELAKANSVLQQTLATLAAEQEIDQLLVHVLRAILQQSGAWSGYLFSYEQAANTLTLSLAVKGNDVYFGSAPDDPMLFQQPFDANIIPGWQRMLTERKLCFGNAEDPNNEICQETKAWHIAQGHTAHTAIALVAGNQPLGLLGIAWREQTTLTTEKTELIDALANQATLAMQLTRYSETAKQAAILEEQEKAARTRAKEQLENSQRRLALLIQQMPVAIVEWNTQFEIKDWNSAAERMFGYSREEVLGLPFNILVPDSAKVEVSQVVERLLSQQGGNYNINENLTKNDEIIICEWYNTPLIAATGELVGVASMALDITKRRQAEAALQQTNELLEQKVAERTFALGKLNQALQAEVVERKRAEQVSRGQTEAMVKTLFVLSAEPVLDNFLGYVLQAIVEQLGEQSGGIWLFDENQDTTILHLNYEDGQIQQGAQLDRPGTINQITRDWDTNYLPLLHKQKFLIQASNQFPNTPEYHSICRINQQRGVRFILSIALSFGETCLGKITIRRTQQSDYTPEEIDLACALAHQATLALQLTRLIKQNHQAIVLEERNRFAYEIHDTIAQGLTGIIVQLQAAEDSQIQNPVDRATHIQVARQLAKNCLAEARRSVWALRPQALDGNDLAGALSDLVEQMRSNVSSIINYQVEGTLYSLAPEIETNLLRIAQEALTNAIKHAQAQAISVQLMFAPERVSLQIQDDGQGFDLERVRQGLGLTSMQMRAQTIGAHYLIVSQSKAGTVVKVESTHTGSLR